ncbi:MAG: hypothetical protein ACI4RI_04555 [Ruminococcus sp.]
MAHSKKNVKRNFNPNERTVKQAFNPVSNNTEHPVWKFTNRDKEKWTLEKANSYCDLIEFLSNLERKDWNEILVTNKKHHHSIDANKLNKCARDRLVELRIEAPAIISLRINGKHRLYGYRVRNIFNVLWYDTDHGDNADCVCRSHLKHT